MGGALPYNRRRTAVQMGGVLWVFPFFKCSKSGRHSDRNDSYEGRIAVQIGGVLQSFLDRLYGLRVPEHRPIAQAVPSTYPPRLAGIRKKQFS